MGPNEFRDKDFLSTKCQRPSRRADERAEVRTTFIRIGNYPRRGMNHKLANDVKMLKGNVNTTKLLFYLKGLEILHEERRGRVKTILMEQFKGILFHNLSLIINYI